MKHDQGQSVQDKKSVACGTILLVEDEPSLREMYQVRLEGEGFQVYSADDGAPGIKIAQEHHPDLILLDIVLNNSDGFSVLNKLKKDEKTSDIPVIMVSNLSSSDDRRRALDLGADDFLIKAKITLTELAKKVKDKLKL